MSEDAHICSSSSVLSKAGQRLMAARYLIGGLQRQSAPLSNTRSVLSQTCPTVFTQDNAEH